MMPLQRMENWADEGEGCFLLHALRVFSLCPHYLVSWGVGLMKSPPAMIAFTPVGGFPLGCEGPQGSLMFP